MTIPITMAPPTTLTWTATATAAKAASTSGVAELALAEGYGYILRSPRLRSIALIHWSMWLLTGFLYQALIFYSTIAFEESADAEAASLTWVRRRRSISPGWSLDS